MHARAGLGAALVGVCVLTIPAPAGSRTTCRLIPDARGDAAFGVPGPSGRIAVLPGAAADDLLSADVSSDGRTVTALFRMAQVPAADPVAPNGRAYELSFRVRGSELTQLLTARTYPTGMRFQYGYVARDATGRLTHTYALGEARGTVDGLRHEVRVHAPAAGFLPRSTVRRGTTLVGLQASVYRLAGQGAVASQDVGGVRVPLTGTALLLDEADGDRYVVGTPSCVRAGR